jgi:acetyl-CoA carboxylase biotin carboxyl carrier protein
MAKKPKTVPKVTSKTKPGRRADVGGVDLTDVERLLAFMDKHGLEEFEYARGGVHIRLKKPGVATVSIPRVTMSPDPSYAAAEAPRPAGHGSAAARSDLYVIKSPIVGTFYSSPSPGSDPFVAAGAKVEAGQVLCIIEAMKLMNEIESDVAGELVEVYAENGKPVEYGEPLFGIRASGKK